MPPDTLLDVGHLPICPTIVTMVALEAVLNPTSDMQPFVEQLFVLEKLMVLLTYILFYEILLYNYCTLAFHYFQANDYVSFVVN
jgi:hypothetical protein